MVENTWKPIVDAPKEPKTGHRGPIIIGMDAAGLIGRTSWIHNHEKGSNCWLLYSGNGLQEWEPVLWVPDPSAPTSTEPVLSTVAANLIDTFDEAARVWGWESDQGTYGVHEYEQDYLQALKKLREYVADLEKRVREHPNET